MGRVSKQYPPLTAERVRELIHYDPLTGLMHLRVKRGNLPAGSPQGRVISRGDVIPRGDLAIQIEKRTYMLHRVAWLYVHGVWPTHTIDHINGDPSDNRIVNLRDVTRAINNQNFRKATKRNKVGVLGVSRASSRGLGFSAFLNANGKSRFLGNFATTEEAHAAYVTAKRVAHEGCTL